MSIEEQGGLGEAPLDKIAESLIAAEVAQAKMVLTALAEGISADNAVPCLNMISDYATRRVGLLHALMPGTLDHLRGKVPSLTSAPYTTISGINLGGPMGSNETFGASILEQAVAAIGPMIQSRRVKDLTAALAEAKDAELGPEIVSDLEGSVREALGLTRIVDPTATPSAAGIPAIMDGTSDFPVGG